MCVYIKYWNDCLECIISGLLLKSVRLYFVIFEWVSHSGAIKQVPASNNLYHLPRVRREQLGTKMAFVQNELILIIFFLFLFDWCFFDKILYLKRQVGEKKSLDRMIVSTHQPESYIFGREKRPTSSLISAQIDEKSSATTASEFFSSRFTSILASPRRSHATWGQPKL